MIGRPVAMYSRPLVGLMNSVAAFIAQHAHQPTTFPVVAEILSALDAEARLAIDAQAEPAGARRAWLQARSGEAWSEARLAHVEQRAFVQLRRELQRRGLWREALPGKAG